MSAVHWEGLYCSPLMHPIVILPRTPVKLTAHSGQVIKIESRWYQKPGPVFFLFYLFSFLFIALIFGCVLCCFLFGFNSPYCVLSHSDQWWRLCEAPDHFLCDTGTPACLPACDKVFEYTSLYLLGKSSSIYKGRLNPEWWEYTASLFSLNMEGSNLSIRPIQKRIIYPKICFWILSGIIFFPFLRSVNFYWPIHTHRDNIQK